jgi:hypothetical protein
MQFAKDSFSMALRERLAALNPARTVKVSGALRPAVVVLENEMPSAAELLMDCFYLQWGALKLGDFDSGRTPICSIDCSILYRTRGIVESGVDRGRLLGELDRELLSICQPAFTKKVDFSRAPNADLGSGVSWGLPVIDTGSSAHEDHDAGVVEHQAQLKVFFFPEVGSL